MIEGALKVVNDYFQKNEKIDFINGYTLRIDHESRILFNNYILKPSNFFAKHGIFNIAQQSMFWRKKVFEKIGYLKEDFHAEMDKEFLIRILTNNLGIALIKKPLGAIRIHENTKTSSAGSIWENDKNKIREKYNGNYDDQNRSKLIFIVFVIFKAIQLKYIHNTFFKLKWRNKLVKRYQLKS